jgi:hypothetical protein
MRHIKLNSNQDLLNLVEQDFQEWKRKWDEAKDKPGLFVIDVSRVGTSLETGVNVTLNYNALLKEKKERGY